MAFDPSGELTGWDLTGFHEGQDTECWKRLGAHEMTITDTERGPVLGTRFSVWAPNAQAVRLIGDFNYWNGENSYLQLIPGAGAWALFVEGVSTGNLYKFEILGSDGVWRTKADPMARFAEAAPHTASIVYESQYVWSDDQWMWYRGERKLHEEPISIYEVHIGSWRKGLTSPRAGQPAGRVLQLAGLHPRRVPAGGSASVRRIVGLSRHRIFRADVTLWLAG